MYKLYRLDNGLRIIVAPMPAVPSISMGIFIGVGSRYESDEEAGVAHFTEHLLFKGTARWPTPKALSEAIEGVGGMLNGGTDKELTVYWAKVARPHFTLARELLVDMLLNSKFEAAEVEKERGVIIEEINMSLDTPQQRASMLVDELLWPGQPMGRDVAGSRDSVSRMQRSNLLNFVSQHYLPSQSVICLAGDISAEAGLAALAPALSAWQDGEAPVAPPPTESKLGPRLKVESRDTEQAHLNLGLWGLHYLHPDRFALDLLNVLLGEGMSSRLFQEVREKRGLAYDIHSYVSHFRDSGCVIISAGVDPRRLDSALSAIVQVIAELRDEVSEEELARAKEFSKGRLWLRLEDSRAVAGWLGIQEVIAGRIYTPEEVIARIEALTPQDLQRVAQKLFTNSGLHLAIVGPVDEKGLEAELKL
ncbi:MAG: pitrilysin family protein [Chloroflexota bacterium]